MSATIQWVEKLAVSRSSQLGGTKMIRWASIIVLSATCVSSAAFAQSIATNNTPRVLVRQQEVLLTPFPVAYVKYIDNGVEKTAAWSSLSGEVQRAQLPNEDLFIEIRSVDTTGNISLLPAKVTASKGNYQFVYRWMRYRTEYCIPENPNAGYVRIGVGLDIRIDVSTRKSNLNVAGLGPFTAGVEDNRFAGALGVSTIGLGTNSAALGGFLGSAGVSEQSAHDADKAIAVVKAVIENNDTLLTPHTLAVIERTPGACTADIPQSAIPDTASQS